MNDNELRKLKDKVREAERLMDFINDYDRAMDRMVAIDESEGDKRMYFVIYNVNNDQIRVNFDQSRLYRTLYPDVLAGMDKIRQEYSNTLAEL